ncbi:transposase [Sessilibacter corallicola]|uniref:IS3 family transposase n=1 Tax=Sessilibacter corallicola TaxID=2904075 RepID=A0ABQ0A6N1_9GAMM
MAYKNYLPKFKHESAVLILDQGYIIHEACDAVGVGQTAIRRWVTQLQEERAGNTSQKTRALTAEHQEIQALREEIKRLKREKEMLKKASALLISETFNGSS